MFKLEDRSQQRMGIRATKASTFCCQPSSNGLFIAVALAKILSSATSTGEVAGHTCRG